MEAKQISPVLCKVLSSDELVQQIILRPDKQYYHRVSFYSLLKNENLTDSETDAFGDLYSDILDWLQMSECDNYLSAQFNKCVIPWWITESHIIHNVIEHFALFLRHFHLKMYQKDFSQKLVLIYKHWSVRLAIGPVKLIQWLQILQTPHLDQFDPITLCTFEFYTQKNYFSIESETLDPTLFKLSETIKRFVPDYIQDIERNLIATKIELDKYHVNPIKRNILEKCTKLSDTFNQFKFSLKEKTINAQYVTNAWLKIYEMIETFELIPTNTQKIRLFDNAALPGAGISAVNHFIKTKRHNIDFLWKANSLINSNGALEDQFGLFQKYPENWMMNSNMNGDVTILKNLEKIKLTLASYQTNV